MDTKSAGIYAIIPRWASLRCMLAFSKALLCLELDTKIFSVADNLPAKTKSNILCSNWSKPISCWAEISKIALSLKYFFNSLTSIRLATISILLIKMRTRLSFISSNTFRSSLTMPVEASNTKSTKSASLNNCHDFSTPNFSTKS